MTSRKFHLHNSKKGAALTVRVTPRARQNEISRIMSDGTIKIKLTAPPVEGKANKALIKFLADLFGVASSRIEIVAGTKGRNKIISILDMDPEVVNQRVLESLGDK